MNRSFFVALAIVLFCAICVAQQRPTRPPTPTRPPASDFNIELLNLEGPSQLESVPGGGLRFGYLVTDGLQRIPSWKPSPEAPAEVAAMKVGFWMEDGAVKVEVIAYLGKTPPNAQPAELAKLKKVTVATLLVHENETVTVNETEQFGIEPIGFRVLRNNLWSVGPPEITNKAQALNITAVSEQRPAYTVTTRNVSHKCINSIHWYSLEDGRKGGGSGLSGLCLIPAGGFFDFRQQFALDYRPAGENAQAKLPGKREIVIEAVVFDDGTFEGEADTAAGMAALMTGSKIQRTKVLQLLRGASETPVDDTTLALTKLKREVTSLSEEVDDATTQDLSQRFASASADVRERSIGESVRNGLRFVKGDILHRIERFEYMREHSPAEADFGAWLKETTKFYEKITAPS